MQSWKVWIPRCLWIVSEPEIDATMRRQKDRIPPDQIIVNPAGRCASTHAKKKQGSGAAWSDPSRSSRQVASRAQQESGKQQREQEKDCGDAHRRDSDKCSITKAKKRTGNAFQFDNLPDQEPENENEPRGRHEDY